MEDMIRGTFIYTVRVKKEGESSFETTMVVRGSHEVAEEKIREFFKDSYEVVNIGDPTVAFYIN
jgi:hypothetical protein